MRAGLFAVVLALIAGPALATPEYTLPTLFDVTGVAAGDTLNIRERPDASAAVIGTLAPDATGVEVVAERSGWAQVNTGGRRGWVSSRFLRYRTDVWADGELPQTLRCTGTEPFWGIEARGGEVVFSSADKGERVMALRSVMDDGVPRSPLRGMIAGDDEGRMTAVIQPQTCSDGMSDRAYGLTATVIFDGARQQSQMLTGCCRIGD